LKWHDKYDILCPRIKIWMLSRTSFKPKKGIGAKNKFQLKSFLRTWGSKFPKKFIEVLVPIVGAHLMSEAKKEVVAIPKMLPIVVAVAEQKQRFN